MEAPRFSIICHIFIFECCQALDLFNEFSLHAFTCFVMLPPILLHATKRYGGLTVFCHDNQKSNAACYLPLLEISCYRACCAWTCLYCIITCFLITKSAESKDDSPSCLQKLLRGGEWAAPWLPLHCEEKPHVIQTTHARVRRLRTSFAALHVD